MRDVKKTISNLIEKQSVAYISSIDEEGYPNTKAMLSPCKREEIKTFYFHTNTSSMRVSQYKQNKKACLYFCDRRFFRGVMLIGEVEVLEDEKTKEELWNDDYVMYYPNGVTDEDYCILKFSASRGRYYRNFKSEDFDI